MFIVNYYSRLQRKTQSKPGANPMTLSYKASVAKNYSATNSIEIFFADIKTLQPTTMLAV
jgi:hypothetical protein